jgi:hypothetical protein
MFDWENYINMYEDLKLAGINTKKKAWNHWIVYGQKEGRICNLNNYINYDSFNWEQYIANYEDLQLAGIDNEKSAYNHWQKHGSNENRSYKLIDNNVFKNFLYDYNETYDNYNNNPKVQFRFECYKNINYMRNIILPEVCFNKNNEAVLIEYRKFPHLEFLIRNAINKLGNNWSYTVVCGNINYEYMCKMCNNISSNIKIIKTDYDNLNISSYSKFLSSLKFWNLFSGNKILIYQEDSCIFKNNIDDFIEWDYIGASWPPQDNTNSKNVGNGGFSLRTKKCMIDVINTISIFDTNYSDNTLAYMKRSGINIPPEDVYFSLNMIKYNIGKVANFVVANSFSSEFYNNDSLGGHSWFLWNNDWKKKIAENNVIKLLCNYNKHILEHRGGWKSILEFLEKNKIIDNINHSNYKLYDTMETHFLWNVNYCSKLKWIGILHCTPFTPEYLSSINIQNLFKNQNFINSLDKCIFIVVLSNYIKNYLCSEFKKIGKNIKVFVLKHPVVNENIIEFDINKFQNNNKKKIIQIGQQLRKMSSIYLLKTNYEKIWLSGTKNIDNVLRILNNEINTYNISIDLSEVKIHYTETFLEYDLLLSENIVFIELFDASANNTVLECIIRNTPIIINKLPAVVEYLGENYPLYFNNLYDVETLLSEDKIKAAYEYLKNMDKSDLLIPNFVKSLTTLILINSTNNRHNNNIIKFNPSIFNFLDQNYLLIREETDTNNWIESILSYSLCKLDENLNIIERKSCSFDINNKKYNIINRLSIFKDYYAIEDIKVFSNLINNNIIGIANILCKETNYDINNKMWGNEKRIFRVGVVNININTKTIKLIKILDISNFELENEEKNWALFENNNNYYMIYSLFPLRIFKLDTNSWTLEPYYYSDNFDLLSTLNFDNLSKFYKKIFYSPTTPIKMSENEYIIIVKKKLENDVYNYYKFKLIFKNNEIKVIIDNNILFSGLKLYLNDVKKINNDIIACFGINDKNYKLEKILI